jgi:hypothetical protein
MMVRLFAQQTFERAVAFAQDLMFGVAFVVMISTVVSLAASIALDCVLGELATGGTGVVSEHVTSAALLK